MREGISAVISVKLPEGLETIGESAFVDPLFNKSGILYHETEATLNPMQELVLPLLKEVTISFL